MLQATHPLCSPPVESLKNFPALLDLGTVLRRWHHQSRVRREDNFPQPAAGFAPFNSSHNSTGLPGHMNTLLAPWFVAPHSATDFCVSHSAASSVLAHRVERLLPSEGGTSPEQVAPLRVYLYSHWLQEELLKIAPTTPLNLLENSSDVFGFFFLQVSFKGFELSVTFFSFLFF